jgi:D-tyrosyl-tRNA(Tyr) deacylase
VRALLQRVSHAAVEVAGATVGQFGLGWLVLVGVGPTDTPELAEQLADKIALLRCFEDSAGKTNLCILDVGGAILLVSQFTLYADTTRGRRPGFTAAAPPEQASRLVDALAAALRRRGIRVETGQFGTYMRVSLANEGPFTIWLEI